MNFEHRSVGVTSTTATGVVISWRPDFPQEVWDEIAPLLESAFDYSDGEYQLSDLLKWCRNANAHLWVYYEDDRAVSAMVTTFNQWPNAKYLHIMIFGGAKLGRTLRTVRDALRKFMLFNDCDKVTACVRPKFAKVLVRYGFGLMYHTVGSTFMEKPNAQLH